MNNFTEMWHSENFSHFSCEMEFIKGAYFWYLGKIIQSVKSLNCYTYQIGVTTNN